MAEISDKSKIILRDIKSFFIIKRIFSFLSENQKLNMIAYNKEFQNICSIDIGDYKRISGKYKIGSKNGKGKEYKIDTNKLIFEGEYLNGKRNENGKEYYESGNLKFEGQYIKGKRWNGKGYSKYGNMEFEIKDGKGNLKEYNFHGDLKFEGEYLNGERNGKGKEYYNDRELLKRKRYNPNSKNYLLEYEGEYLNGIRNGKGKEYNILNGKLEYEGEYLNGKRNGKGKEYYEDGKLLFEGEYLNGKNGMEKDIIKMVI